MYSVYMCPIAPCFAIFCFETGFLYVAQPTTCDLALGSQVLGLWLGATTQCPFLSLKQFNMTCGPSKDETEKPGRPHRKVFFKFIFFPLTIFKWPSSVFNQRSRKKLWNWFHLARD